MAEVIIVQRMWQRRDSAAAWASENPILAFGEIGVEGPTAPGAPAKAKVGDGVRPWTELPYFGSGEGGTRWYSGPGIPASALGADGDFYLRTNNGDVFEKAAGAWSLSTNLMGPPALQLRATATHIQWAEVGGTTWTNLVPLADLKGQDGRDVEMRASAAHIQWRKAGAATWTNLVALSDLKGEDGRPAEFRFSSTHLQWRLVGDAAWVDLVPKVDLQGPVGEGSHTTMGAVFSVFDLSGGGALSAVVRTNCAGTIVGATVLAAPGQFGSATFDIKKCALPVYPAGLGSIVGSTPPLLNGEKYEDTDLVGWSTTFAKGDVFVFSVGSVIGLTDVTIQLGVIKENG